MGYRERESLRLFREEEAERERLEEERRLAPIREAESKYQQTVNELAKVERENVSKLRDDQFYTSPELVNARMSWPEANKYNAEQARLFTESTPDYFPCEANHKALIDYIVERNLAEIISAEMWKRAFHRLDSLGLLEHRPAPEAEPIRELEHIEPVQEQPRPNSVGHDLQTGELRSYTPWEVEQMTADEYRRAFNLRNIYGRQIDPRTREEAL